MKYLFFILLSCCCGITRAQYYYKDIIGTKESSELIKTYQKTGVTQVAVASYDADGTRNEDFAVTQTFSKPHAVLQTTTRGENAEPSVLTSFADTAGRVLQTIDSTASLRSETNYQYDALGRLTRIESRSTDTAKSITETETHNWIYANGHVQRMLRIVNNQDTTYVDIKLDSGRVVEERSVRRGVAEDPVYYYYNGNRLTDIVRFNKRAKRLLPEYLFEYAADGKLLQKITVPSNSSAYLIWRYQYDANGLKIREAIYDRYKTLNGKVEYTYARGD